jgi:predicted phosphohydrolase
LHRNSRCGHGDSRNLDTSTNANDKWFILFLVDCIIRVNDEWWWSMMNRLEVTSPDNSAWLNNRNDSSSSDTCGSSRSTISAWSRSFTGRDSDFLLRIDRWYAPHKEQE